MSGDANAASLVASTNNLNNELTNKQLQQNLEIQEKQNY